MGIKINLISKITDIEKGKIKGDYLSDGTYGKGDVYMFYRPYGQLSAIRKWLLNVHTEVSCFCSENKSQSKGRLDDLQAERKFHKISFRGSKN